MYPSELRMFFIILLIRISCVYFVQSYFVPDEYWQSLEISHKLAFGYGYSTWEWDKKIRSCVYPYTIHLLYNIIPDSPSFIIHGPRVLQAVLSTVGDFFAYKLAKAYFGKNCAKWTVFNILTSWFFFYCSPRTLTNMTEASLTSCGFFFYPWTISTKSGIFSHHYLWFAGLSTAIRPTAVVTWLPLYVWHIWREKHPVLLLINTFLIGYIVVGGMLLIDKWCYNDWVFTPYNFFLFNWSNDIGAFYGCHNFLWYFLIGLPTILGLHIFPFACGYVLPRLKPFYLLILWVLIIFSVPSHKEFRFLLPILHICMMICGVVMNEIWSGRLRICGIKISHQVIKFFAPLLILFNASVSLYLGFFHQRGVIDATLYLSKAVNSDSSILFLMPCHSTPYYSYIHKNIPMKFLTCEPNFENEPNYVEEAEEFFQNPDEWLFNNYDIKNSTSLPSHIVLFDTIYHNISTFLNRHEYHMCFTAFHSHLPQGKTGSYVYIYCK